MSTDQSKADDGPRPGADGSGGGTDAGTDGGEPSELKRVMGPKLLLLFIVGDIIGAGIFAITGDVAAQVGGVAWLPFLVAFAVAALTAMSYLELVSKHAQAAGAALFVHKAFGVHFVTFIVAFAVVCSGITSASTSSGLVAENLLIGLEKIFDGMPTGRGATLVTALVFIAVLALINLRGVGESVKFNVVLTLVVIAALVVIIGIGAWAMVNGNGDAGRVVVFESNTDRSLFAAVTVGTTIAFFAMVGFEDSINMVEEVREPDKIFPRVMLTGLGICALLYVLVAVAVVVVIPPDDVLEPVNKDAGILLDVVRIGAPGLPIDDIFPFLTVFAVANTALINMLMASRLLYGMAKQDVLPRPLARVLPGRRSPWIAILFTTAMAFGLITYVRSDPESDVVGSLAGTTGLLLLGVFSVVHVSCLVLRRRGGEGSFRAPVWTPWVGAVVCAFLVGPWARDREDWIQYRIGGALLAIGVVLWAITWMVNRGARGQKTGFRDVESLED
ncbi:APC family permease [Nocardioides dongxiaopingii]|uniref:APC family permease n=1 Tax=Nocardioides dongxiaopingii TaxID=2576036 RepID=UPI0010C76E3D|nr:APC family permease [Nocardioides dongxiaopingii]